MKIQVTLHLESRYHVDDSEVLLHDAAALHKKVEEWANLIARENNYGVKHLGLHFDMKVFDVFRLDTRIPDEVPF